MLFVDEVDEIVDDKSKVIYQRLGAPAFIC